MPISSLQKSLIQQQKLNFINAHLQAFDVEPLYPLEIFKDFVAKNNDIYLIESSCKIEADKLLAARFLLFMRQNIEENLAEIITFFRLVENRVNVQINYDILYKFLGKSLDVRGVNAITMGSDLRENIADSSLKIHFRLDRHPEKVKKVETALNLDGNNSAFLRWIALQTSPQVGIDFYLNGRTEIELYCELTKEQFQQPDIQTFLKQTFSSSVLKPLQVSRVLHIGLSKDNADPVIYYRLDNMEDLLSYFSINDAAYRVHNYYQHQENIAFMWAAMTQEELEKSRIDNIRLYYDKFFCDLII